MYLDSLKLKNPNAFVGSLKIHMYLDSLKLKIQMYSSVWYINSTWEEDTGTYQTAVKIADPAFFYFI